MIFKMFYDLIEEVLRKNNKNIHNLEGVELNVLKNFCRLDKSDDTVLGLFFDIVDEGWGYFDEIDITDLQTDTNCIEIVLYFDTGMLHYYPNHI